MHFGRNPWRNGGSATPMARPDVEFQHHLV
jgi:hypothetical protein